MNLLDRIVEIITDYHNEPYDLSIEDTAKAILALVEEPRHLLVPNEIVKIAKSLGYQVTPTVSEQKDCCEKCEWTDYQTDEYDRGIGLTTTCRNSKCFCHSPSSGVEPTAPVGGWESEFDEMFVSEEGFVKPQRDAFYPAYEIKDFFRQTIKNREREIAEGIKLLKVAKCPDPDCDNHGTIAMRISDDEWEPQQCQWCFERNALINKQ
jgi:hypothetical protein